MTPEDSTVGSTDSATMVHPEGSVEERLRKEMHVISDERDGLRNELESAQSEIARLERELSAARATNAELLEKAGMQDGTAAEGDGGAPNSSGNGVGGDGDRDEPEAENEAEAEVEHNDSDEESDESSSQGTDDSSAASSESEEALPPTSTDDDIRLRAARTLIWADSAIKRSNNAPRSSAISIGAGSVGSPSAVPATVHVQSNQLEGGGGDTPPPRRWRGSARSSSCCSSSAGSQSSMGRPSTSRSDGNDNESFLSIPESEADDHSTARKGPFGGIRQFLEESIAMEEKTPDKPPISSYKYCNEAFKKLNESGTTSSTTASGGGEEAPKGKPAYCNEAMMMKLNKKKTGGGTFSVSKLFN